MDGLGERVKQARLNKRMSQKDLAQAIGRKQVLISSIERGLCDIPTEQLKKIAATLDVSVSYLLNESEGMAPPQGAPIEIEMRDGDRVTRVKLPADIKPSLVKEMIRYMHEGKPA